MAEAAQPFLAALVARGEVQDASGSSVQTCAPRKTSRPKSSHGFQRLDFARTWIPIGHELLPDPETTAERLEILGLLAQEKRVGPLVIHRAQWEQNVPSDLTFTDSVISFAKGDRVILLKAGEKLVDAGYERVAQAIRGQFAIRGGIMDVFSGTPRCRCELNGTTNLLIPSAGSIPTLRCPLARRPRVRSFREILTRNWSSSKLHSKEDLIIDVEAGEQTPAIRISADSGEDAKAFFLNRWANLMRAILFWTLLAASACSASWRNGGSPVGWWRSPEVRGNLSGSGNLPHDEHFEVSSINFLQAPISRGFVFPAARLAVLSDAELFGRSSSLRQQRISHRRERMLAARAAIDFTEFEFGDYVVHLEHGIGRYEGLQKMLMIVGQRFSAWNTPAGRGSTFRWTKPGKSPA